MGDLVKFSAIRTEGLKKFSGINAITKTRNITIRRLSARNMGSLVFCKNICPTASPYKWYFNKETVGRLNKVKIVEIIPAITLIA